MVNDNISVRSPDPIPVLADIQQLDARWLSLALDRQVDVFETHEIVGEGYASRMYRVIVRHEDNAGPLRLILKLATANKAQRDLLSDTQLFREVYFYRYYSEPLRNTGMLPDIHVAEVDAQHLQTTLLMEDIGDIPHKPFRENLENSLAAVEMLANVHAAYWCADVLNDSRLEPLDVQVEVAELERLLSDNLAVEAGASYSFPYLRQCMQHLLKLVKWVITEADRFTGPVTLVHGDFHARNVHFMDDRAVLFDWQVTERGRPARDLVYWMLSSVDVEDADEFEPLLINRYLQTLAANGVDYPRKAFTKDYNDVCNQLIPRFFCYQTLIHLSEDDDQVIHEFLERAERLARKQGLLNQLRVARIVTPPIMFVLRRLGLRKQPNTGNTSDAAYSVDDNPVNGSQ